MKEPKMATTKKGEDSTTMGPVAFPQHVAKESTKRFVKIRMKNTNEILEGLNCLYLQRENEIKNFCFLKSMLREYMSLETKSNWYEHENLSGYDQILHICNYSCNLDYCGKIFILNRKWPHISNLCVFPYLNGEIFDIHNGFFVGVLSSRLQGEGNTENANAIRNYSRRNSDH
jgi:hypothetical protein